MRLVALDPQFIKRVITREMVNRVRVDIFAQRPTGPWSDDEYERREDDVEYRHHVDTMAEADGLHFLCPKCVATSGHSIVCWFEDKVPDDAKPGPGRWNPIGTGYDDLSFVPGKKSQSVQLLGAGGCHAHFTLTNGNIEGLT